MQRKRFAKMQIMPLIGRQRQGEPAADFCRGRGLSNANSRKAKLRPLLLLLTACAGAICYVGTYAGGLEGGLISPASAQSPATSRGGPAQLQPPPLGRPPIVRILRDDRVATLEMDYNARKPFGQYWTMSGSPDDDAGFLVTWWPQATAQSDPAKALQFASEGLCLSAPTLAATTPVKLSTTPLALVDLPLGARWIVTGNRRVQLQPLDNDRDYRVRVQRLSARGKISSRAAELSFNGGDNTRVAALRSSLTYFDDFNLPEGAADELLWNNANSVSTDPRFNLFFIKTPAC